MWPRIPISWCRTYHFLFQPKNLSDRYHLWFNWTLHFTRNDGGSLFAASSPQWAVLLSETVYDWASGDHFAAVSHWWVCRTASHERIYAHYPRYVFKRSTMRAGLAIDMGLHRHADCHRGKIDVWWWASCSRPRDCNSFEWIYCTNICFKALNPTDVWIIVVETAQTRICYYTLLTQLHKYY